MNDFLTFVLLLLGVTALLAPLTLRLLKRSFLSIIGVMLIVVCAVVSITSYAFAQFGIVHIIWMAPLATVIVLAALLYTVKEIKKPLNDFIGYLDMLASGRTDISVKTSDLTRNDEFGKVFSAFSGYAERLKRVTHFSSEIGKGNLDVELTVAGEEDVLGSSLLVMRDNLKAVIEDTQIVVEKAVEEGMLEVRMDTGDKSGVWKEMGESINNLLASFSSPLMTLNKIIVALADGDLTHRYTEAAKGDVLKMAENLNSALDNIDGLLNQVSKNAVIIDESSTEMRVSSEEMSASTAEIASSTAQMSHGAQAQVAKVDEASTLIEGILNSSKDMGQRADRIHKAAKIGSDSSEKGLKMVSDLVTGMDTIANYTQRTSESINVLTERSNEISKVLSLISEIASQTNLLALNAAIEAAQAGDAGRGFAVVAEEIRKLAEDSKRSAKQIERLVVDVQNDTSQAANVMGEMKTSVKNGEEISKNVSISFREIFESSDQTLRYSREILDAAQKQNQDINNVVTITESIVVIAEETAAGSEQIASSSTELSAGMDLYNQKTQNLAEISETLKEGVSMLKLSGTENTVIFKMKEAYENEKALLDALLNNMPDFIYFKDLDSKFIRASKSMMSLHGLSSSDSIVGKSDFDFFGDHAQKAYEDEQKIIRTQEPLLNLVEKEDKKDGSVSYVSTTKLPLRDTSEQVIGTFGISRDITGSKLAELELSAKAEQLEDCIKENKKLKNELKK